jgi:hypothetical protein
VLGGNRSSWNREIPPPPYFDLAKSVTYEQQICKIYDFKELIGKILRAKNLGLSKMRGIELCAIFAILLIAA